jgi:dolichyl-phosphate beta-glucosyltransferase
MQKVAIIIPCFNEEKRLQKDTFVSFLNGQPDVVLFFVNDGSKDDTLATLTCIQYSASSQIKIINLDKNNGKANAVQTGLLAALAENKFAYAGYLDADLSTSLQEFYRLYQMMKEKELDYIFGSRIKMINTSVKRTLFRHLTGRMVATAIDSKFKLGIYDTQCGAKCFRSEIVRSVCNTPFITKWFFDVEIFLRIKKNLSLAKGLEAPLLKWEDTAGSKITILNFTTILKEIFLLHRSYSKQ